MPTPLAKIAKLRVLILSDALNGEGRGLPTATALKLIDQIEDHVDGLEADLRRMRSELRKAKRPR